MGYIVESRTFKGTARRPTDGSEYLIVVELDEGPFDYRAGDRIATVAYTDAETALRDLGASAFQRLLEAGEPEVEVKVPVNYSVWKKEAAAS